MSTGAASDFSYERHDAPWACAFVPMTNWLRP